jgi:hypothetical protein
MADRMPAPSQEVMDDGPRGVSPAERWRAIPRARRRALTAAVALLLACAAAGIGGRQGAAWLEERRLADRVQLRASIDVRSWSTTMTSRGRVDFFARVYNTGRRPVSITAVRITQPGLSIRSRPAPPRAVDAGEWLRVPLSVILDCTRHRTPPPAGGLRGEVAASSPNGRARDVVASFDRATLITDVADTLCRIRPGLRDAELSGPVGSGQRDGTPRPGRLA